MVNILYKNILELNMVKVLKLIKIKLPSRYIL